MKLFVVLTLFSLCACEKQPEWIPTPLYAYPEANAPFQHPRYSDPVQGQFKDCWLISTLSALALSTPQVITNAITQNDNDNYVVRLYDYFNSYKEVWVPVNLEEIDYEKSVIYTFDNRLVYWPALIETACIKYFGYSYLEMGGRCSEAMKLLVGQKASDMRINNISDKDLYSYLLLNQENVPLVLSTIEKPTVLDGSELVKLHSYAVIKVISKDEIIIRNPWSSSMYDERHGEITINFTMLRNNFETLTILNQYAGIE